MDLNQLTKEELIEFAECYEFELNADDEKKVLISKINEGLENLILKNGYVDIGDEDYRCLCLLCKKKITSEEVLPDGYEEMFVTMASEFCKSCFDFNNSL